MKVFVLSSCIAVLASMTLMSAAHSQSGSRNEGWELGTDVVYQTSHDINFNGGSHASLEDDLGLAVTFGYRLNDRLELQFSLDWQTVDYDVDVVSDPWDRASAHGASWKASRRAQASTSTSSRATSPRT